MLWQQPILSGRCSDANGVMSGPLRAQCRDQIEQRTSVGIVNNVGHVAKTEACTLMSISNINIALLPFSPLSCMQCPKMRSGLSCSEFREQSCTLILVLSVVRSAVADSLRMTMLQSIAVAVPAEHHDPPLRYYNKKVYMLTSRRCNVHVCAPIDSRCTMLC
jgi:hypothetical protein